MTVQDVVQNAPAGIFIADKNDDLTAFNRSMESITGLLADEVMGRDMLPVLRDMVQEGDPGLDELFRETKRSLSRVSRQDVPLITADGELEYHSISLVPLVDKRGNYDGMIGYVQKTCDHGFSEKGLLDKIANARKKASILMYIPVIVFRLSSESGWPVLFVSENISQLGYSKEEFGSGAFRYIDIVHPDDRGKLVSDVSRFERTDEVYFSGDYRLLSRSGDTIWVNEFSLLKKEGDMTYRHEGIIIDITERKRAETFLKAEHEGLDKIASGMGVGLAVISRDFRTVWANDVLKEIFGDVENRLCYEVYNKRQAICEKCAVKAVFEDRLDRSVTEQHGIDREGKPIWSQIVATPLKDNDGNITAAMEAVVPITERKQREIDLKESKARIESILRSAPVGIGVIRNSILEEVNDRCCEILGYSREELIGQSTRMFFEMETEHNDVGSILRSGIKKHSVGTVETRAKRKDGCIIDLLISATPIYPGETSKGISFTIMDITETKRNEKEIQKHTLELEQLDHLKDLFSDIIRHDLLNPAGTIKGYAEILEDLEEDAEKLHLLHMIQDSNKRLIDLIENASKYEKLNSLDELDYLESDLVGIFENVIMEFEQPLKEKNIRVVLSSDGPCVYAVNPFVSEVFANLLSNAIKYGPEGEKVSIAFHEHENTCKVTVADQGDGIPDDDKSFVFDRFKRLDKKGVKGTGLGLAIVKRIMELHGGNYGVENNPEGKGSVFWVTFRKVPV